MAVYAFSTFLVCASCLLHLSRKSELILVQAIHFLPLDIKDLKHAIKFSTCLRKFLILTTLPFKHDEILPKTTPDRIITEKRC